MNAPTALTTPTDAPAPSPAEEHPRALRERQVARLERLTEAGMELIEALVAQAKGVGAKVVDGEVGLAFSRVSRAVRLAVLLQDSLSAGQPEGDSGEAPRPDAAPPSEDNRDRAVRVVKRVARDHCRRDGFEVSVIVREASERLADDDIYGLVASRPVGELVALLCRDFGLEPNWDALAGEAWAQAEIAGGAAGSPFVDDDPCKDDEAEGADPPEVRHVRSFDEALGALARDPEIVAAARRGSG